MSSKTTTIKVSPEQKAKALRDAARNSKVKVLRPTPSRRDAGAEKHA